MSGDVVDRNLIPYRGEVRGVPAGTTVEDLFSLEELAAIREKYYVSLSCGILCISPRLPLVARREELKK